MSKRMTRNAIECRNCHDVIESKHRHDFRTCSCGNVFVDGGLDYHRVGYTNEYPIDRREWTDDE